MFKILGAFAAMMSSVGATPAAQTAPIYLVAEPAEEGVRVKVLGASPSHYEAVFSLEVSSNGNRSLHRGSARLGGGEPVTLSTVTLGGAKAGEWRAHLKVEPVGSGAYEQTRTSF